MGICGKYNLRIKFDIFYHRHPSSKVVVLNEDSDSESTVATEIAPETEFEERKKSIQQQFVVRLASLKLELKVYHIPILLIEHEVFFNSLHFGLKEDEIKRQISVFRQLIFIMGLLIELQKFSSKLSWAWLLGF